MRIEVGFSRLDPPEGLVLRVPRRGDGPVSEPQGFVGWLGVFVVVQSLAHEVDQPPPYRLYLPCAWEQTVRTVRRLEGSRERLLGREAEVDAVHDRLARGRTGGCEIVLVEGEPGIGKTRFLADVLAGAGELRQFRADAEELERTRPFGPLSDALGCRVSSADPLGAEIARLIDDGAAEFRIVERFAGLLERLALDGPLIVAVDDLQWADPSTVTALRFAARHLADVPAAFVLAFRPIPRGDALERFVVTSVRDGALRVTLGPLDDTAVAAFVEHLVGLPPGPGLRSLVAHAGGNPFYVNELVDALAADGQLHAVDGTIDTDPAAVPVKFRSAVVRYLRFLGESRLSLLRWAAVLGSRFAAADLSTVSGTPTAEMFPVLDEAVRAGLLVNEHERLAFRHDLLREALYEDMGAGVRASLHRDAGRALTAAGAAPLDVAYHLLRAPAAEDALAVDWLVAAERQAIDLETKAALLESALERLASADRRSAEIGARAIVVMGQAGRVAAAEALAERLRSSLDEADRALLSAALAEAYSYRSDPAGTLRHCAAARHVRAPRPRVQARLLASEAAGLLLAGRVEEAEAAAHRCIEAAERLGTQGSIRDGRAVLCLCALASGRGRDAAALATETTTMWPAYSELYLQMSLVNEDRLVEAEELFSAAHQRIADRGTVTALSLFLAVSARAALLAGRLDDALARAEASLVIAEQAQMPISTAVARGVIARVALHRGSLTAVEAALGQIEFAPGIGVDLFEWARALALEAQGDQTGAGAVLASAWERHTPLRYVITWTSLAPDLVRLHVAAGERGRAASVAAAIETGAVGSDAPSATGSALRCRALVDDDPDMMRSAVAAYESGPRVLETAAAREDAATLLGGPDALDLLRIALAAYEEAGAAADAARVRAALRARGVRVGARGGRRRPVTGWDSLTPTERKVVALAADGLTSRQIGERLYISGFTVGTHLRHVYQKLDVNSRIQLAAEWNRHQTPQTDVS